jgi:hypothetical protein
VLLFVVAALVSAGGVGLHHAEAHVKRQVAGRVQPEVVFVDLPEQLSTLAYTDIYASVAPALRREWTDDSLCRDMAALLARVGWVEQVEYVRRTSDAQFQINCRYRLPVAMVQQDGGFFLVDRNAVRLPGTYLYDSDWRLVQGVSVPPPPPGVVWASEALDAGLAILAWLADEPFSRQITAVLVENFGGRLDPWRSHIELATDRAGGRIRWGSAPGIELEENLVAQKLAILRENFRRTGRVDDRHRIIDISTFPDRYTVPG